MSQTVLVADDSQTIRQVVQMALKASRFEVKGVASAREAVEAAQQQPAVILLDYYMPDGSGYDVCRALKNNQATRAIPIIMLGGTYQAFDADRARECGAVDVVMKPFNTDSLIAAIEGAIKLGSAPQPPVSTPTPPRQAPPAMPMGGISGRPSLTPAPESQPRIPVNQPRRPQSGSQSPFSSSDSRSDIRQRMLTPRPGSNPNAPMPTAASAPPAAQAGAAMSQEEIQAFIQEEVKNAVRAELPGLLRNVMGEVFQQKVLPRLLQHSDKKIEQTIEEQLSRRIAHHVRAELERLLPED